MKKGKFLEDMRVKAEKEKEKKNAVVKGLIEYPADCFYKSDEENVSMIAEGLARIIAKASRLEEENSRLKKKLEEDRGEEFEMLRRKNLELERKGIQTLNLPDYAKERRDAFFNKHLVEDGCSCRNFYYEVHPTGIGTAVTMVCSRCNGKFTLVGGDDF